MTGTLAQVVAWWATHQSDRKAIRFPDDQTSFSELHHWTDRVAANLVAEGLQPGDRVGIFASGSMPWCIAAISIIKAGGILVPLNYRYVGPELASVVKGCTPKIILTDDGGRARVESIETTGHKIIHLDMVHAFRSGADIRFEAPFDPDATIVIAYTSGSTAQPKGVMFSHRSVLAYAFEAYLNYPQHKVGASAINVPPLFTGGGTIQLIQFLIMGITTYIEYEFIPQRVLDLLINERIEIFCGVPTFFERISELPAFEHADLSHIQHAATGGARVPLPLLKTWLAKGVVVRQLYGLTEAGGNSTVMSIAGAIEHPEKCGNGGIFTKHRVVNPDGQDCAVDEPGEIWVRGPAVMQGYWNNPEATAQTLVKGWLRTGDIGKLDAEGNITLVDRLKDMIISGGLNIWPMDIENVISQIDGVIEVAVIAAKDQRFGETPLAIIHASQALSNESVIAHCNSHLADYKVPRYLVFEDQPLPRLATGKIAKRLLKERYEDAAERLQRVR